MLSMGILLCIATGGCGVDENQTVESDPQETLAAEGAETSPTAPRGCQLPLGQMTVKVDGISVDLLTPEADYQGDLLVLHPWNAQPAEWCQYAQLCLKASQQGYRLIMPDMGRSIYMQAIYPETREDWRTCKTIQWVKEILIPDLRNNYCLLKEDGENFLLGASAGARGAMLLAEEMPNLFGAVAALSGDYDPSEMKGDNIYRGFLGEYDAFPQRWETVENVMIGTSEIKSSLYLGHGKADDVVTYMQTLELYNTLKHKNPHLNVKLNLPEDRGGDFAYWSSEVNAVFDFFESTKAGLPEGADQ
jgi:pimeloyl-ACP methyl ester carboxylesterase